MERAAFLTAIGTALAREDGLRRALALTIEQLGTETGTIHLLGRDGQLHLEASGGGIPEPVLATIRTIPVGKGMAGLAVERREPVTACNIQTDTSGDVRPGAKATGLQGAIVVPILQQDEVLGALGVAVRAERTFSPAETNLLLDVGRAIAARA
jgi:L-methionine (R)-S-oxide reductase